MSILKRLYWINFLEGCYFHAPIVSLFLTSNAIGVGALFFSQVFYAVGTLLFEVPFGVFADKYGHEKSIRLGYLIDAICLMLLVVYPNEYSLYILYFFRGAGGAFISGSLETVLYNVDQKNYTKNLAIATQLMTLGDVFAVIVATVLFGLFGDFSFEILILLTVSAQLMNFVFTFGLPNLRRVKIIESGVHEVQILKSSFDLLRSNMSVRKLLIWSIFIISGTQMLELSAPLIMRDVGVSDFLIPAVFVIGSLLSVLFLKLFVYFESKSFSGLNIVRSTCFAVFGIIFVSVDSPIVAYLSFLLMYSLRDVLMPLYYKRISDLASDHNRATVLSVFSMYKYVALLILRAVAGVLDSATNTILMLCIFSICGIFIFTNSYILQKSK